MTDPAAIEIIIGLGEVKVGDKIKIGRRVAGPYHAVHDQKVCTVISAQALLADGVVWYNVDLPFTVHPNHIIGWERGQRNS